MTFRRAVDEWNREVDAEAERLMERGIPPWEAIKRAERIVSRRRQDAACAKEGEPDR